MFWQRGSSLTNIRIMQTWFVVTLCTPPCLKLPVQLQPHHVQVPANPLCRTASPRGTALAAELCLHQGMGHTKAQTSSRTVLGNCREAAPHWGVFRSWENRQSSVYATITAFMKREHQKGQIRYLSHTGSLCQFPKECLYGTQQNDSKPKPFTNADLSLTFTIQDT